MHHEDAAAHLLTHILAGLLLSTHLEAAMAADTAPAPAVVTGQLVPLRTKDEVRASLETQTVYVVEIPARFANAVKE